MKRKIEIGLRIVMGLIYFVFGLNKFFGFIPLPEMPEAEANFIGALIATGFMFPLIAIVEIATGALLLAGRFVYAAAVVAMPVTLIIFLTHAFLAPSSIALTIVLLIANLYILLNRKEQLQAILAVK
ncbi:DoxX family membrane protein [Rapidithrix thailandica]|uniref:DoxX family membrane protein n=1 Tax=Rapidithrix thailandica TaxID=413964 RepID=A0AAW9S270_9BACT